MDPEIDPSSSSWSNNLVTTFTLKRRETELVTPAKPTPHEMKPLSDIDDQDGLRYMFPLILFYRGVQHTLRVPRDPAKIIRNALSLTLVSYYPLAGRLREGPNRKLTVDCTGEGVLFTDADADVTLDQFGPNLHPLFPNFKDILCTLPASSLQGILHSPLLHIQVTRLMCGGFIFAMGLNHTMIDGPGMTQFLGALAEIARGAFEPSIVPVWRRELLMARDSPRITCTHREYNDYNDPLVQRSFFIRRTKIEAIRDSLRRNTTVFEILTAFLWRCRTVALQLHPNDDVRLMIFANLRGKSKSVVPVGYYGNAFVCPSVVTSAGRLCGKNWIAHALHMVKNSKGLASQEYIRDRPCCYVTEIKSWMVSDLTRGGFTDVDFGWGKAVYGGVAPDIARDFPVISHFVAHKNGKQEEGVIVSLYLPSKPMNRFALELDQMLQFYGPITSSL